MKSIIKMFMALVAVAVLTACGGGSGSTTTSDGDNDNATSCTLKQVGELSSNSATGNIKCNDADGIRNTEDFPAIVTVNGNLYTLEFVDNSTSFDINVTVTGLTPDTNTTASLDMYVVDAENDESNRFSLEGKLETNSVIILPAENKFPTANADTDKTVEVHHSVSITGSGTDTDGSIVSYGWTEGATVLADTATFDYTPTNTGIHTLTLTVMDDDGDIGQDSMLVNVTNPPVNNAPTVEADIDTTMIVHNTATITGTASDSDGTIASIEWTENGNFLADTLSFDYTPTTTGNHTLTLTVMDDDGASNSDTMVVTVNNPPAVNNPPTANAGGDKTVEVHHSVSITGTASDSDGTIASVEWTENGNFLADTLSFNYTPSTTGNHTLTLTVTDDDGATGSDTMVVNSTATPVVSTPTISMANQTVDDNGGFLATDLPAPTVSDVEANAVYSIVSGTTGLSIDSATGIMTYDNNINPSQSFSITIKVTNPDGGNDSDTFTLSVNDNA